MKRVSIQKEVTIEVEMYTDKEKSAAFYVEGVMFEIEDRGQKDYLWLIVNEAFDKATE